MPVFTVEVGRWENLRGCRLSCDQVHEAVQNTILPAIGARHLRPAAGNI